MLKLNVCALLVTVLQHSEENCSFRNLIVQIHCDVDWKKNKKI